MAITMLWIIFGLFCYIFFYVFFRAWRVNFFTLFRALQYSSSRVSRYRCQHLRFRFICWIYLLSSGVFPLLRHLGGPVRVGTHVSLANFNAPVTLSIVFLHHHLNQQIRYPNRGLGSLSY